MKEEAYQINRQKLHDQKTHEETLLGQIKSDLEQISRFRENSDLVEYLGLLSPNASLKSEGPRLEFGELKSVYQDLERNARDQRTNDSKTNKTYTDYCNELSLTNEENFIGFRREGSWITFVGASLEPFIRNNKIEHYKTLTTKKIYQFKELISKASRTKSEALREVKDLVKATEKKVAEENFIKPLDKIQFRAIEADSTQLFEAIDKMERLSALNYGNENDLFLADPNNEDINLLLDTMEKLNNGLAKYGKTSIEIRDCFEVEIKAEENGQPTDWVRSLNNIGSEGTDKLVKILVFFALIDAFKKRTIRGEEKAVVHCAIDEIGILATSYIKDILTLADKLGIRVIIAGHVTGANQLFHDSVKLYEGPRAGGKRNFVAQTFLTRKSKWDAQPALA